MNLSRRQFLSASAALGGGLLIGFTTGRSVNAAGAAEKIAGESFAPNAFIRIDPNGQVTLIMPYVEMGQGTYTSIPMLIAEELEVDLKQVRLEHAPPNEKLYANPLLGVQATGNSNAIRGAWQPLRQAGATARVMLVSAAAKRWNVDLASCRAQSGEVRHVPSGRTPQIRRACRRRGPHAGARERDAQATGGFQAHRHRRRSVWTHPRKSTELPSMASMRGRRVSSSRRLRNRRSSAVA